MNNDISSLLHLKSTVTERAGCFSAVASGSSDSVGVFCQELDYRKGGLGRYVSIIGSRNSQQLSASATAWRERIVPAVRRDVTDNINLELQLRNGKSLMYSMFSWQSGGVALESA